jgi:hypothetical protein
MLDIHKVIRRKQAQHAQLAKEIELLQQAADKLREVAPLLAEADEDDSAVLAEVDEEIAQPRVASMAAAASAGSTASPAEPANPSRPMAPRWP